MLNPYDEIVTICRQWNRAAPILALDKLDLANMKIAAAMRWAAGRMEKMEKALRSEGWVISANGELSKGKKTEAAALLAGIPKDDVRRICENCGCNGCNELLDLMDAQEED